MPTTYTIYVCPTCGSGPETTAYIPGCGPQAVKRGDNLRRCRSCGFKGGYVARRAALLPVKPISAKDATLAARGTER